MTTGNTASGDFRDVIAVGASAGGVEALVAVISALPADFPASILIVLHVLASGTSVLDAILGRAGRLPVSAAVDGTAIARGHVYVAPPDHHMLLGGRRIFVTRGPRESGHRPAIDSLFRSVAESAGRRAIGVILSGALDDGAAGLRAIKERGGLAVVQDPADALYPSMPEHAVAATAVDRIAPLQDIAAVLAAAVSEPIELDPGTGGAAPHPQAVDRPACGLTCPECGAGLWEQTSGPLVTFACDVGHSYALDSLIGEQADALETALGAGLRALEERADLLERMAVRARQSTTGRQFGRRAEEARAEARTLEDVMRRLGYAPAAEGSPTKAAS